MIAWAIFTAFLVVGLWLARRKRNRYTGLRAPFDDDRSSIRNFKRMHTP